jgi:hypothetical protein
MPKLKSELIILILLYSTFTFIVSCKKDAQSPDVLVPSDFLPQQGDIEGWIKGSGSGDFMEATNQSSLYDIIDGGAEIYINYGFTEGVQQLYYGTVLGSAQTLALFIADMGDTSGAYNLYHDPMISPTSFSIFDYGDEARLDEGLLFEYVLDFRIDKYYISITLSKEASPTESLQIIQFFASEVEANIEG